MNVIATRTLNGYKEKYSSIPSVSSQLDNWYKFMRINSYHNILELRKDFPTADNIKGTDFICINICGNNYRLIFRITFRITWGVTVFIKDFCTHTEYSKKYC